MNIALVQISASEWSSMALADEENLIEVELFLSRTQFPLISTSLNVKDIETGEACRRKRQYFNK